MVDILRLVSISALGLLVLLSYYFYIIRGEHAVSKWWFRMDDNLTAMRVFPVSATFAALSFLYIFYALLFDMNDDDLQRHAFTEMIVILSASLLWAPIVYRSFETRSLRLLAAVVLGIVAGSSIALVIYVSKAIDDGVDDDIFLVVAASLFSIHVTFMDFGIWNFYYLSS